MIINNKQGYQLVEASFMMPLIILASLSIVFLVLFFYQCVDAQCKIHEQLIEAEKQSSELYKTHDEIFTNSGEIKGMNDFLLRKEIKSKINFINESMIIRMKDKSYDIKK